MDFEFSPAAAVDLDRLVILRIEAMRKSLTALGRFDRQRAAKRFKDSFDPNRTRIILVSGEFAGCVALRPGDAECLEIQHFYLVRKFRGKGLGGSVLRTILREADGSLSKVRLEVLRRSDAIRFYIRHGFAPISESAWDIVMERLPKASVTD